MKYKMIAYTLTWWLIESKAERLKTSNIHAR